MTIRLSGGTFKAKKYLNFFVCKFKYNLVYLFNSISTSYGLFNTKIEPVGWGCRIHRLHLCREVRLPQWVSCYDTKQSDGEGLVMLELWGMLSTPSLLSLLGSLWSGVIAPDRGPIYGSNRTVWHLNCVLRLNWVVWDRTVFTYNCE